MQNLLSEISQSSLQKRIEATLLYWNIFDVLLSVDDLKRSVFGQFSDVEFLAELNRMPNVKIVDDYVFLNQNFDVSKPVGFDQLNTKEIISKQKEKEALTQKYLKKVNRWNWLFKHIPWLKFVAVCNYLPINSVNEKSDIDLLIITEENRIFLTRVFLTLALSFFKLWRHGDNIAGSFCLSFYLIETNLNFKQFLIDDDIYFIYWVLLLKPIYGDSQVWQNLRKENSWIENYLPNFDLRKDQSEFMDLKKSWFRQFFEWSLNGKFGSWIENKFECYFLSRHAKKAKSLPENSSVIVNKKVLKFHNSDRRKEYLDDFKTKLFLA